MSAVVIDTNVLIYADNTEQKYQLCAQSCIHGINVAKEGIVVLDSENEIMKEYRRYIVADYSKYSITSQLPSAGLFLKWLFDNLYNDASVEKVDCSHIDFENYPIFTEDSELIHFDRSDRKFVVVAMRSSLNPTIVVAIDRGWWNHKEVLRRHVDIEFVCEDLISELAEGKKR